MRLNNQLGQVRAICIALAIITLAVFGRTLTHQFVNYDDNSYVYENPIVARGLTWRGAALAWSYGGIGHWHPLTWFSHMLDCQIYGLSPGGHHLTNVLLHAAAAVLLFLALREMTGALWRSAFAAAIFAVHPLRVESVAWIAERKDVLSGVFFMWTLWLYARYVRRPSRRRYAGMAAVYALGLLSKDTLVTLPFVLLLLDWWPLRRAEPIGRRVVEKIPLFLLAAGSCAATLLAPENVADFQRVPLLERLENAVISYGAYLKQTFYPTGLAIPYLYPADGYPVGAVVLAVVLLAAISAWAWACRKGRPYLLVGWLWYLGMLVPTIGIVQISYYTRADRYTYLPGIGLALAVAWLAADWSARWRLRQEALGCAMAALIGALMTCAWTQTGYWKNSETLWIHTLAIDKNNYAAHSNLGVILGDSGQNDAAIAEYQAALKVKPDYVVALNNLGGAFLKKNEPGEAIVQCQKALAVNPDYAPGHNNLGSALCRTGRVDEGIAQFREALQKNSLFVDAWNNLGNALMMKGQVDEAIAAYKKALAISPKYTTAQRNLEKAVLQK